MLRVIDFDLMSGHCEARSNLLKYFFPKLKPGYIYIVTNYTNTTLYVGVTSDLHQRIKQHKNKTYPNSFTAKYNLNKLVYFEQFQMIGDAIGREKQLKAGSRLAKTLLIENLNPEWKDLFFDTEEFIT
jgi:putative endonuclease